MSDELTRQELDRHSKEELLTDLEQETAKEIDLFAAVNDLFYGDRSDPALWEALRVAAHLETRDELKKQVEEEIRRGVQGVAVGPIGEEAAAEVAGENQQIAEMHKAWHQAARENSDEDSGE